MQMRYVLPIILVPLVVFISFVAGGRWSGWPWLVIAAFAASAWLGPRLDNLLKRRQHRKGFRHCRS